MKIAVVGGAGRTGALIVSEARRRGDDTVAVVRRADAETEGPRAIADARNVAALRAAIRGCDAVAFAVGPTASTPDHTVMRDSMAAVLEAMAAEKVRRIVMVGAEGPWRGSGDPLTRFVAKPILNRVMAGSMGDPYASEVLLRGSDARWTAIRPAQLTDGSSTRHRRRRERSLWFGMQTTRRATAAAVLDALHDDATVGASYSVAR
ncbi:SDR family oxidoreductase [soil metagenome]